EQVLREKDLCLQILSAFQVTPLAEIAMQLFLDQLARLLAGGATDVVVEEAARAPVISPADGVRVGRRIYLQQILAEKAGQKRIVRHGQARNVLIEPVKEHGAVLGFGSPCPKAPYFCFFKNIVAREELVRPFPGQNYLEAVILNEF